MIPGVERGLVGRLRAVSTKPVVLLTGSSLFARLAVLSVLVAGAHAFEARTYQHVAYLLAVTAAAQIIVEPGAGMFLLGQWFRAGDRLKGLWIGSLRIQCMSAAVVCGSTVLIAVCVHMESAVALSMSLGLLAAVENVTRFVRTPLQAEQRFGRFASIDVAIGAGRLLSATMIVVSGGSVTLFVATNLAVSCVLCGIPFAISRKMRRRDARRVPVSLKAVARGMWPYSTVLPSLYSQAPVIIVGLVGGVRLGAAYAVMTRITQPAELLPQSLAAARLPKLIAEAAARETLARRARREATAIGVVVALLLAAVGPVLLPVLGVAWSSVWLPWTLLSLALIIKCGNYQLVALAVARARMRERFAAAGVVAVMSVAATVGASTYALWAVAAVVVVAESSLAVLLRRATKAPSTDETVSHDDWARA